MNRPAWQKIEELFAAALELPAAQRADLLARLCGDDAALLAELTSLLAAHDTAGSAFDQPAYRGAGDDDPVTTLPPGSRLGSWQLGELIGRGGAGDVYLATRADGSFQQRVAVKVLRREAASQTERFNAERQILARLEHPGIARLLDGGITADGRPYAVVEYVDGQPLIAHCRDHALDLSARLALFAQVCEAVAYAHRNLIVHRDLKSGNILVTAQGRVKLLDFGIAKQLDAGAWPSDDRTSAPFTADYAAPEQLTGDPVTTATDVYALGVLLFELLTDKRPWSSAGLPLARVVQRVVHDQAPIASRAAARQDGQAETSPIAPRLLAGDLDAIIAKCLRKEPMQRYRGVDELRDDLQRYQRHAPVLARERQGWYVLALWLRRNRWLVAGVAVVFASLATGLALAVWQAGQAREQSRRAEAQARIARAEADKSAFVKDFLLDIFNTNSLQQADPLKAQNTTALQLLDRAAQRLERTRSPDPATNDELLNTVGLLYTDLRVVDTAVRLLKRRLELARQSFPADDPRILDALVQYGTVLYDSEDWKSAIAPLSEADAMLNKRGDSVSLNRAKVDFALGDYWRASDIRKSTMYARRAVQVFRDHFPNDPAYAYALLAAGWCENNLFHARAAEAMISLAVQTQRRQNASESQQVQSIVTLADVQRGLLMNGDAERNYRSALEMSLRANGPKHIDTLQTQMRYGTFLRGVARYREAIALLRAVEAQAIAALGEQESFHLPTIRLELAVALLRWGDIPEAESVLRKALAAREKTRPNTVAHANMLATLAALMTARGDYPQADALLLRARDIYAHVGTKEMRTVAPVYRVQNLLAWGRVVEALAEIDATEAMVAADLAKDPETWNDPLAAQKLRLLRARAQLAGGKLQDAERTLRQSAPQAVTADQAPSFAIVANERALLMGEVYSRTLRLEQALPELRSALQWRKATLAGASPLLREAQQAVAAAQRVGASSGLGR